MRLVHIASVHRENRLLNELDTGIYFVAHVLRRYTWHHHLHMDKLNFPGYKIRIALTSGKTSRNLNFSDQTTSAY